VKSFRDRNPYAVGIISLLAIGVITGLAFMVGLLHLLEHTYEMEATFTQASGLRSGDDVKVAGVKVGRVTGVSADREEGLVHVRWVINDGVDIRDGAKADIALETLLGSKYIRITDAAEGEHLFHELARDERVIPHEECSGDGLCVERTTTPEDLFDITRETTERINATDNERLNQLIQQLAGITEGKHATVTDLINGIRDVSTAISERDGKLASLLDHADEVSANLAEKDQQLVQLIDASKTLLDFLVARRAELATALGEGSQAVVALSRLIEANQTSLDAILDDLAPTLELVQSHLPELNRSLAIAGPAFYGQSLAGTHGPWQDIYIAALGPDIIGILEDVQGTGATP
jgi:phospholipid/cholesterol/gamma-HCH transport system substrate-binding protein